MAHNVITKLRKRNRESLRVEQLEESLAPLRSLGEVQRPHRGWVRAIREGLGMTNVQLAKRMGKKAPQTIEDMQEAERAENIQLGTLRRLAEAMGCRLVYAVVPAKPLAEMRRDKARHLAERVIKQTAHSMRLEGQGVSDEAERRQLENLIEQILADNPKTLWQ